MTIITESGTDAVTMCRVAAGAGMSSATVYRYWANRDELILDLLDRSLALPQPGESDDPIGDLRTFVDQLRQHLDRRTLRAALAETVERAPTQPELETTLDRRTREPRAALAAIIRRGQQHGLIASGYDPESLAMMLVSPLIVRSLTGSTADLDQYLDAHVTTFFRLVTP